MESVKRRLSCPQTVQLIWDAIDLIRVGKQQSSMERILAIMKKKHNMDDEDAMRQLNMAVVDNLLYSTRKIGSKGCQAGVQQVIYNLPYKAAGFLKKDGHDWYCFKCQKGGSVLSCKACFRVYHAVCCNREDLLKTVPVEKFMCPICVVLKSPSAVKLRKDDLNTLLSYTCNRLKEKPFRDLNREPPKAEDLWREKCLIYNYVDLTILEEKTREKKYRRLEEFEADVQNIVHNVVVYYGVNSPVADMARQMLRDCSYDLREIHQCQDCYRVSNEKKDRYWFCQPCNPPHELVFAKQKGYPFWPAKVIRRMNSGSIYDVRFFGGPHERATVEKVNIRPITTSPNNLGVKRSTSWTRACDEMKKHQEILAKRTKISPITPTLNPESFVDEEEAESEGEPRPKKIERYVRTVMDRSSPKEAAPDQFDDWTPIRRSERARNKSVCYTAKAAEESPSKAGKDGSASDEDKEPGSKPRRKSEPAKAPEVRKRGRPPSTVPKSMHLAVKRECSSEGSEEGLRRTNPRRSVNTKTETPQGPKKEPKVLPLLVLDGDGALEVKRPVSQNVRCGKTEDSKREPKTPARLDKQLLVKGECKVQMKRLVEDAGPSEDPESEEPKPKRRALTARAPAAPTAEETPMAPVPVSSSTPTPDDLNVVSSSSQLDTVICQVSVGIQTSHLRPPMKFSKCIQTDVEVSPESVALTKAVDQATRELGRTLQADLKQEKENALKALKSEFQAKLVENEARFKSLAGEELKKEVEQVRLETETKCKALHEQAIKALADKHRQMVSEIKKKQWCYNCENEAIYHCCWNTSYCSTECQQLHWKEEHKRTCRRKR